MFNKILAILGENWSFFAVALLLGLFGEVIKSFVIGDNKEKAKKNVWKRFYIKTLPIHPVLSGALLGLFLSTVIPEAISSGGVVSSVLYFSASSVISTWLYMTLKSISPAAAKMLQNKLTNTSNTNKTNTDKEEEETE
jgi:nitrate reductase NapE component